MPLADQNLCPISVHRGQAETLAILPDPQASLGPTGLSGKRFVSGISVKINFVNSHI